jgi:hypothetical protein
MNSVEFMAGYLFRLLQNIDGTPREVRTADITVAKTPAAIRMRMAGKRE